MNAIDIGPIDQYLDVLWDHGATDLLITGGSRARVRVDGHLVEIDNTPAVTYVDENRTGYVFMSERLTATELVRFVVSSNLIDRAQNIR